jgi:hypothetical protein
MRRRGRSRKLDRLKVEGVMDQNPVAAIADPTQAAAKACEFWRGQDRVLDCMRAFTLGWFERRHVGTLAALESAQRMWLAPTPVDAAREYQAWASGSLQRIAQDAVALQRELMDIGEALTDASHQALLAGPRQLAA